MKVVIDLNRRCIGDFECNGNLCALGFLAKQHLPRSMAQIEEDPSGAMDTIVDELQDLGHVVTYKAVMAVADVNDRYQGGTHLSVELLMTGLTDAFDALGIEVEFVGVPDWYDE